MLENLSISPRASVFIGNDALPPVIERCVIISKSIEIKGKSGYIGIL